MPSDKAIQRFLEKARKASLNSDFSRQKIGAVMIYGGKVLAVGCNTVKTSPMQKHYNKERGYNQNIKNNGMCHAEMMLLQKTKYLDVNWSRVSVYIYRENRGTHMPSLAKPCPACERALSERGITQIYYTTETIPYEKL